ncbi:rod shape-determining protein RodA [Roseateles sp.]|uniref:rod shape-determining protein RodA n=1 Tax=Roseateles sp. TaxID=1971397 RepID=UPI003BA4E02B
MTAAFNKQAWWHRIKPWFSGFDIPLVLAIAWMMGVGMVSMYSAGFDHGTRFVDHGRNMLLAIGLIFVVSQVPPQRIMSLAIPLYTVCIALLLATALFGITKKGATRWLNVGIVIQPSELAKIATPLMLAWWFQKREGALRLPDFLAAFVLLMLPVILVAKQPDLGTSLLVAGAGLFVIFFAGLSWRLIVPAFVIGALGISALVMSEETICQPDVKWKVLREYQKHRVCTLLDPNKDPLGKGFHIIQGGIAIGSGGLTGKGFMQGTQTHLEFIPERTTDFIFAAYGEEFGLVGALALLAGFTALILRGLAIASDAATIFARLMAGAVTMSFFTYVFVNIGMVSGILPVVGVPLPFISYGGTAMVTLGLSLGLLMSIAKSRRFNQS